MEWLIGVGLIAALAAVALIVRGKAQRAAQQAAIVQKVREESAQRGAGSPQRPQRSQSPSPAVSEAAKEKYFQRLILTYWGYRGDPPKHDFGAYAVCIWVGRSKNDPAMLRLGKINLGTEKAHFFDIDELEERGPVFVHNMSGEPMAEGAWEVAAEEYEMGKDLEGPQD